jgi:solute carrier family 25 phosphate transporter 3
MTASSNVLLLAAAALVPGAAALHLHMPLASLSLGASASTAGGSDWRYFVAGGVSAALSHGYTTPLDVIKTRMQTNPLDYNGSVPLAVRRIVEEEGPLFLLQGLAPTCVGYGIEGALKFGCYELCKPLFKGLTPSVFCDYLLASVVAGAVASVVLCPAEDLRIRQVADPTYAKSAFGAIARLSREKGPFASFGGLPAMLSKQVPYTMGKQVSFDFLCHTIYSTFVIALASGNAEQLDPRARALVPFLGACLTSVIACALSHPGDMVLTEYFKGSQAQPKAGADARAPRGTMGAFMAIIERDGPIGLFAGLKARFLHVAAIIIVQLVVYDAIKQMLGLPSTGAH